MPLNPIAKTCKATTRRGKPCANPALLGGSLCRKHAPREQLEERERTKRPFRYGTYTMRLVKSEEMDLFNHVLASLRRDFGLKLEVDDIQASLVALFCVKLYAAIKADDPALIAQYDQLIRQNIESLKAARDECDGVESEAITLAEWAADLVANYRNRQAAQEGKSNETASGSDRPAHGGSGASNQPPRRDE